MADQYPMTKKIYSRPTLTPKQRRVFEKFLAAPRSDQEALVSALAELFTTLKREWESKPGNRGKTVSYTRLWKEFTSRKAKEARKPTG